jgi:hypothetical protein
VQLQVAEKTAHSLATVLWVAVPHHPGEAGRADATNTGTTLTRNMERAMSQATDESTQNPKRVTTMSVKEVNALANRLMNRGATRLTDQPEQQNDLRLAARVIRALVRSFNHADVVAVNGD